MSYPEPQEPAGQPMSWKWGAERPATPGEAAVALRRARRRIERVALSITIQTRSDRIGSNYTQLYRDLSDSARNLLAAEAAWERMSGRAVASPADDAGALR